MEQSDFLAAMRFKEFRFFIFVRFLFTFSFQAQMVVLGFYVYNLSNSPLALGNLGLSEAIPAILIGLIGGGITDKSEKKGLFMYIMGAFILSSFLIFLITSPELQISDYNRLILIYGAVFISGIARGFIRPTTFSLMGAVVPREHYSNSILWYNTSYQIATVSGPILIGIIYGYTNISIAMLCVLGILILGFAFVFGLKRYPPIKQDKESLRKSIAKGFEFVFKNKMMLNAMSLDFFAVFFGGAVALLPIFAKDILNVGPQGLGILRASESIGAILTLLILTRFPIKRTPWKTLLLSIVGFGASIICFGLSKNFFLSILCLFSVGVFDSISVMLRSTIMQLLTPEHMRGRVSSINSVFVGSSNEIGAFESGVSAKILGTVPAVVFGGCMTCLIAIITYLNTKKMLTVTLSDLDGKNDNQNNDPVENQKNNLVEKE